MARPIAGGVAARAGPSSPLNEVAGLGSSGPVDERDLDAVEQAFDRDIPVQVELSSLAEPSIAHQLTYALVGFENVLGRTLPAEMDDLPPM